MFRSFKKQYNNIQNKFLQEIGYYACNENRAGRLIYIMYMYIVYRTSSLEMGGNVNSIFFISKIKRL